MYKKTFEFFDKIKASEDIVDKAVKAATDTAFTEKVKNNTEIHYYKPKRKATLGLLAACFAVVIIFGVYFGVGSKSISTETRSNGFIITANAYEAKKLGENADSAIIGAYTSELSGGWAMYYNLEQYKDFSPNFFQSYVFCDFTVEGEEIESVTFKSTANGTYFALSPAGIYLSADEDKALKQVENAMKNYSQLSLNNSQYSAEELKEYSDGLSFGRIYADTFTFTNSERREKIDFGKKLEFVIESNHNNTMVSEKLDHLWKCEQKLSACKADHTREGGESSAEEERLYKEIDTLSEEIRKLVLKDATVDVVVKFTDGSTLTKSFRIGLTRNDGTLWLTVSEIK